MYVVEVGLRPSTKMVYNALVQRIHDVISCLSDRKIDQRNALHNEAFRDLAR
jgi:hypothetical protein